MPRRLSSARSRSGSPAELPAVPTTATDDRHTGLVNGATAAEIARSTERWASTADRSGLRDRRDDDYRPRGRDCPRAVERDESGTEGAVVLVACGDRSASELQHRRRRADAGRDAGPSSHGRPDALSGDLITDERGESWIVLGAPKPGGGAIASHWLVKVRKRET